MKAVKETARSADLIGMASEPALDPRKTAAEEAPVALTLVAGERPVSSLRDAPSWAVAVAVAVGLALWTGMIYALLRVLTDVSG
jgi:hypothetical protein